MARTMSLSEAAERLGLTEGTVRRWVTKLDAPHTQDEAEKYWVDPVELRVWRRDAPVWQRSKKAPPPETVPLEAPEPAEESPPLADTDPDPVPLVTPKPTAIRPRRARRSPLPPEPELEPAHLQVQRALEPEQRLPTDPELRKKHELDALLKLAVSGTIERIPQSDADVEVLGWNRVPATTGISGQELDEIDRTGGIRPWIEERYGPGRYRVLINGRAGSLLHEQSVEIPNLYRLAKRLEAERLELRNKVEAAQEEKRNEREQREEEEKAHQRREYWTRDLADMVLREAARRVQWAEFVWGEALARATAEVRVGFKLNRIGRQLADLRSRSTEGPIEDDEDCEDQIESESLAIVVGTMEFMEPFLDSIQRVREFDLEALRDRVSAFLWSRALQLHHFQPWEVAAAVDHLLPVVPDGRFVPWFELIPPPPPTPECSWDPSWGGHAWAPGPVHGQPVPRNMTRHAYSR